MPSAPTSTLRTMPRSTIERCSSGSWTGRRASTSWSRVTGIGLAFLLGVARLAGICTTAIGRIPAWRRAAGVTATDRVGVHRRRVGDHRRLRRPDPPPHLPVRPRSRRGRRRDGRRRSPPRSACTPTSPATTSTSSPPAATSRSPTPGAGRRSRRRAGRPSKRYVAVADAIRRSTCPVRSDDLVLALLGRALDRLPQRRGRGDGRGGRRRPTAGRWPPG